MVGPEVNEGLWRGCHPLLCARYTGLVEAYMRWKEGERVAWEPSHSSYFIESPMTYTSFINQSTDKIRDLITLFWYL